VLSDSFNTARFAKHPPRTTAEQDEKDGYLPVVNVVQDSGGRATLGPTKVAPFV
jgi:hypothetical protein